MTGRPKIPAKDSEKSSFEPRHASGAFEPRVFEPPVEKAAEPASAAGRTELFNAYLQRKTRLEAAGQVAPGAHRGKEAYSGIGDPPVSQDSARSMATPTPLISDYKGMRGTAGVQRHQISPGTTSIQRAFTKVPVETKSGEWTQRSEQGNIDCWYNDSYPQWHFTVWLATEDEHVSCSKGADAGTKVGYVNGVMTEVAGSKRKGEAAKAAIARGWEILHDARASIMLNYTHF